MVLHENTQVDAYANQYTPASAGATRLTGCTIANISSVLYGKSINDFQAYAKDNSSTGNVKAVLINSSGSIIHTFWTAVASSVFTSGGSWSNETSTPYAGTVAVGDCFALQMDSGSTNGIGAAYSTSDVFDGVNTVWGELSSWSASSITTNTGQDYCFKITDASSPPSTGTLLPPPVAWI